MLISFQSYTRSTLGAANPIGHSQHASESNEIKNFKNGVKLANYLLCFQFYKLIARHKGGVGVHGTKTKLSLSLYHRRSRVQLFRCNFYSLPFCLLFCFNSFYNRIMTQLTEMKIIIKRHVLQFKWKTWKKICRRFFGNLITFERIYTEIVFIITDSINLSMYLGCMKDLNLSSFTFKCGYCRKNREQWAQIISILKFKRRTNAIRERGIKILSIIK